MSRRVSRRGFTIAEMLVVTSIIVVLSAVLTPLCLRLASHRALMGHYAEDLRTATRVADLIAREVRGADAVLAGSGPERLVLRGLDGQERVLFVEPGSDPRAGRWAFLQNPSGVSRLGVVGDLRLRYDARRLEGVRAIAFDVVLPVRSPGAVERVLSSRAALSRGGSR